MLSVVAIVLSSTAWVPGLELATVLAADHRAPEHRVSKARSQPGHRYVSARAYFHAMLGRLAELSGDREQAEKEIQLALVYDADSAHLARELARLCLASGKLEKASRLIERSLELRSSVVGHALAAQIALARGDHRRAAAAWSMADALDRQSPSHAIRLAQMLAARGQASRAMAVLRRAARRRPGDVQALAELADLETRRGRFDRAVSSLERALGRAPGDAGLIRALSGAYERVGRYREAAELWRAVDLGALRDPEALWVGLRTQLWVEEDSRAAEFFRRIEASSSDEGSVAERAGLLFLEEGRFEQALPMLEKAQAMGRGGSTVALALARGLRSLERRREALAVLGRILPGDESYLQARTMMAEILEALGEVDRAKLSFSQAHDHHPTDEALLLDRARLLFRLGQGDDALALLGPESDGHEISMLRRVTLGRFLFEMGRLDRMETVLSQADLADGPPAARLMAAELMWDLGRRKDALTLVRGLLRTESPSPEVLVFMAERLESSGAAMGEAWRLAFRARGLAPRSPDALAAHGLLCLRRNDAEGAVVSLQRAVRLRTEDPSLWERLGDAWVAAGARDQARGAFEMALRQLRTAGGGRDTRAELATARLRDKLGVRSAEADAP